MKIKYKRRVKRRKDGNRHGFQFPTRFFFIDHLKGSQYNLCWRMVRDFMCYYWDEPCKTPISSWWIWRMVRDFTCYYWDEVCKTPISLWRIQGMVPDFDRYEI